MPRASNFEIPDELKGVSKDHIDRIEEKVANSYSKERYEEFQGAVKKIVLETLGSDEGRAKIKEHATEATKDYLSERGWQNKTFWIPVGISIVSTLTAIAAIVVAFIKKAGN